MKTTFFCSVFALTALLMFQSSSAEARHYHHRNNTRVEVGMGNYYAPRETYVVRSYVQPVVATPVYVGPTYYNQGYASAPVYVAAPVYPAYVEQVYVTPARRPALFSGLSFSWNFCR